MKKIILTGDRPTGRLHLGHYVGSLKRRVELQNSGEYDEIYIMIADAQALTDNMDNPEKIRQNIIEVALDYMSCGLDPAKTVMFVQSEVPQLFEMTAYYMNLVTVSRLQRNPTVKAEIQMRNFETSIPVGFFTYPISQAADITAFQDGKAKMSKSLGNGIYISDSAAEVKKKVMSMYTDPDHIRVEDPGKIEGNTVFTYLDVFSRPEHFEKFLPEYENLDALKAHYSRGGLGDVKVKKFLIAVLEDELVPIRARRKELEKDIRAVYAVLAEGSEKARKKAMKAAMKINYFKDEELIAEQVKRFTSEA